MFRTCVDCHKLDPEGNAQFGVPRPAFYGTDGRYADDGILQLAKVPQLRNAYDKVGMFGTAFPANSPLQPLFGSGFTFQADQVRGFGFANDGSVATIFDFHSAAFANFGPDAELVGGLVNPGGFVPYIPAGTYPEDPAELPPELSFLAGFNAPLFRDETGTREKRAVEAFLLAFDSNFKPVVGQQVTLRHDARQDTHARIDLLRAQATRAEPRPVCDLVVHGNFANESVGYLYNRRTQHFESSAGEPDLTDASLRERTAEPSQALTYTCAPPGSGRRMALRKSY